LLPIAGVFRQLFVKFTKRHSGSSC
jgi:hypothetical protein